MLHNLEQSADNFLLLMDRLRKLGPRSAPPMEANISPTQLALINFTASNPGCGIQAMASELNLSKPTVSISVSQLEGAGYLTRQPDPNDGRAIQLFLTPEGQELHRQTQEFRSNKFKRLLKYLTHEQRTILLTLLESAIQSVENENKRDKK
ncbi:MAG: MarR family transcriptional regulator [Anaerolineae bacterium]|nr:MarR family transcriptional regulator [Anaerolineae bacterium]